MLGPGASSGTQHVTVPCVWVPQSRPLLTGRKLHEGELSLALLGAPTWFLLPYRGLSQLLFVQRECVSRNLGLPQFPTESTRTWRGSSILLWSPHGTGLGGTVATQWASSGLSGTGDVGPASGGQSGKQPWDPKAGAALTQTPCLATEGVGFVWFNFFP